jgi:hypothetical protein
MSRNMRPSNYYSVLHVENVIGDTKSYRGRKGKTKSNSITTTLPQPSIHKPQPPIWGRQHFTDEELHIRNQFDPRHLVHLELTQNNYVPPEIDELEEMFYNLAPERRPPRTKSYFNLNQILSALYNINNH